MMIMVCALVINIWAKPDLWPVSFLYGDVELLVYPLRLKDEMEVE